MFRLSTPHTFLNAMLWASMQIFAEAKLDRLVEKQFLLTGYLEYLIQNSFIANNQSNSSPETKDPIVKIITPANPAQRGTQLSLMFSQSLERVQEELQKRGVVVRCFTNIIQLIFMMMIRNLIDVTYIIFLMQCDVRKPNVIRVAPIP